MTSWTVLIRESGPRWLGPDWWRDQGYAGDALDRTQVQLRQGENVVPVLWQQSPDGWGLLFYGQTREPSLGSSGGYVLTVGEPGLRVTPEPAAQRILVGCQNTTQDEIVYGPDEVFRSTAPMDVPWLWQGLRPVDGVTVTVSLSQVLSGTPVGISVTSWGQSAMPANPDHHLRLIWNGAQVDEHYWDGDRLETWSVRVPAVSESVNTIGFVAPGGTEAPVELTWLDEFKVTWTRSLALEAGSWESYRADGSGQACIPVPDRGADALVAVAEDASGTVRYSYPNVDGGVARASIAPSPDSVGWLGVSWDTPAPDVTRARAMLDVAELRTVEYLAVVPEPFRSAVIPLVDARIGAGLRARTVTPEAVYDTYGWGHPDAAVIQELVADLTTEGNLRYLLLVGDTSPHPDRAWDVAAPSVPTAWVRTMHVGATPSDYALATGGTGGPLVAVGRLPVRTVKDLETVIRKTLAWRSSDRLLLVSDDEPAFASLTERLAQVRATGVTIDAGQADARSDILRWLGQGPGVLVYTGHGSMALLGDEKLLVFEDGANWRHPAVVATWSCLCASFAHPDYASLAEAWLLAPGGVAALVGPTGETTTGEQSAMALAFQEAVAGGAPIGDAMVRAWEASNSENSRHGFVLLGDPALQPMPRTAAGDSGD